MNKSQIRRRPFATGRDKILNQPVFKYTEKKSLQYIVVSMSLFALFIVNAAFNLLQIYNI